MAITTPVQLEFIRYPYEAKDGGPDGHCGIVANIVGDVTGGAITHQVVMLNRLLGQYWVCLTQLGISSDGTLAQVGNMRLQAFLRGQGNPTVGPSFASQIVNLDVMQSAMTPVFNTIVGLVLPRPIWVSVGLPPPGSLVPTTSQSVLNMVFDTNTNLVNYTVACNGWWWTAERLKRLGLSPVVP